MAVPFSLEKPRYDQSTFVGRFRHFMDVADPRCLAPGTFFGMSMDESIAIIKAYKANPAATQEPVERLWLAKKIYTSAVHPDTGDVILQPFRMSGYAIYGTPITVGMLLPNPTLFTTVFWQTVNQTHNAFVNYNNRNASQPTPVSKILQGYAGAVVVSVSLAVGLNEAVKRASMTAATRALLQRFVPYPAVATASTCNMLLMRQNELDTGIFVKDKEGTVHGLSQAAAKEAITQTAFTRAVLPAPILIIPPIAMMLIARTGLLARLPVLRLPVEAAVCALSFIFGLPFAISLFPQEGAIAAAKLEPQFRGLKDQAGSPIDTLYFNKGL
eukprot:m.113533 g.113533  ORF g.113533 m.113533 type:complete len:328 (-) comp9137_c0_seq1:84-1067(-)